MAFFPTFIQFYAFLSIFFPVCDEFSKPIPRTNVKSSTLALFLWLLKFVVNSISYYMRKLKKNDTFSHFYAVLCIFIDFFSVYDEFSKPIPKTNIKTSTLALFFWLLKFVVNILNYYMRKLKKNDTFSHFHTVLCIFIDFFPVCDEYT